jgi:hypothetical protein
MHKAALLYQNSQLLYAKLEASNEVPKLWQSKV